MKEKIALFVNINRNYFSYAQRCFELFKEFNPGVFDFFIITSDPNPPDAPGIQAITLNPNDYIKGFNDTGYPPESFLYYAVPNLLYERGYTYSMHIDADVVCLKELDFSWLSEDFVFAGSPRMRNNLSEQIDAWYYLNQVNDKETITFLEGEFNLQNKNNIIDIQDGVMVINNQRWVSEQIYEKSYDIFNECISKGYSKAVSDTDKLLSLLILDTDKSFYRYLDINWNWYYEQPKHESFGGEDAKILHMAWLKPWGDLDKNKNRILKKGHEMWNKQNKQNNQTIHIIGCPGNPSSQNITIDPFARVSYYLTTYLHRSDWNVEYYGYTESTIECSKKWGCVNIPWKENYTAHKTDSPPEVSKELERDFCNNVKPYLKDRVQPGDIVLCTWSTQIEHLIEFKSIGVKLVDAHVGHYLPSPQTSYHVYASDSLRSWMYAKDNHNYNNRWHDVVIPPMAHSAGDYTFTTQKDDYFLFMSRLIEEKGLSVVFSIAKQMREHKFKIAGSGDWNQWKDQAPSNVEYIGYLGGGKRAQYLSQAKAVLTPALYFEPFGLTAVEAAISGTPIITTEWGGYTNNVIHGVTGFRCTHLSEFIEAIKNIDEIDPNDCRAWGEVHSAESLIMRWEDYLIRVARDHWHDITLKDHIKFSFRKQ